MKSDELDFQRKFILVCSKMNWSCYHVDGSSGIPDILMFRLDAGMTVELKVSPEEEIGHSIKGLFKATQMPFYIRQIQESLTPVYICIKFLGKNPSFVFVVLKSVSDIISFFSMKRRDVFQNFHRHDSIESMINLMTGGVK